MDTQANLLLDISNRMDSKLVKARSSMKKNIEAIMSEASAIEPTTADGILAAVGSTETWAEMKARVDGLQALLDVL